MSTIKPGSERRRGCSEILKWLLLRDWLGIGLLVGVGEWFPLRHLCLFFFSSFLHLFNYLYLNPQFSHFCSFYSLPPSCLRKAEWASSCVGAWLLARVTPLTTLRTWLLGDLQVVSWRWVKHHQKSQGKDLAWEMPSRLDFPTDGGKHGQRLPGQVQHLGTRAGSCMDLLLYMQTELAGQGLRYL